MVKAIYFTYFFLFPSLSLSPSFIHFLLSKILIWWVNLNKKNTLEYSVGECGGRGERSKIMIEILKKTKADIKDMWNRKELKTNLPIYAKCAQELEGKISSQRIYWMIIWMMAIKSIRAVWMILFDHCSTHSLLSGYSINWAKWYGLGSKWVSLKLSTFCFNDFFLLLQLESMVSQTSFTWNEWKPEKKEKFPWLVGLGLLG